jgi:hypothetical protein
LLTEELNGVSFMTRPGGLVSFFLSGSGGPFYFFHDEFWWTVHFIYDWFWWTGLFFLGVSVYPHFVSCFWWSRFFVCYDGMPCSGFWWSLVSTFWWAFSFSFQCKILLLSMFFDLELLVELTALLPIRLLYISSCEESLPIVLYLHVVVGVSNSYPSSDQW